MTGQWRDRRCVLVSLGLAGVLVVSLVWQDLDIAGRRAAADQMYATAQLNLSGTTDSLSYYVYGVREPYRFDRDGFPVFAVDGHANRHPIQLIQIALEDLSAYRLDGDASHLVRARRYAGALHKMMRKEGRGGRRWSWIPIPFPNSYYPFIKVPWISGMVQGQALSLLVRLYYLTADSVYLTDASQIASSFGIAPHDGGFTVPGSGGVVFEEVVSRPATHILNGHIFADLGLYDYARQSGDTVAARLYQEGRNWVVTNLPRYDWHGLSYYDDPEEAWAGIGHPGYQRLHPLLLRVMNGIEPDTVLMNYAARWEQGYRSAHFMALYLPARNYFRLRRVWRRDRYDDPTRDAP